MGKTFRRRKTSKTRRYKSRGKRLYGGRTRKRQIKKRCRNRVKSNYLSKKSRKRKRNNQNKMTGGMAPPTAAEVFDDQHGPETRHQYDTPDYTPEQQEARVKKLKKVISKLETWVGITSSAALVPHRINNLELELTKQGKLAKQKGTIKKRLAAMVNIYMKETYGNDWDGEWDTFLNS